MNEGGLWLSILKTTASPSPISTIPAFSPGPQITRGPDVGSLRSHTFDDLYEQCSLHMTEKMPSSVIFGVRPRITQARANSSALNPCSAASSGVTLLPVTRIRPSSQRPCQPGEEGAPVCTAQQRVGRVFRVGHQPQHGAGFVEHAGDRARRAVEIVFVRQRALRAAIAECNAAL